MVREPKSKRVHLQPYTGLAEEAGVDPPAAACIGNARKASTCWSGCAFRRSRTAHALVSTVQPHAGDGEAASADAATIYQLLSSEAVLREAGVTADQVSLTQSSGGLRLEVTAASAPLAAAQCSSMLLAARLHAEDTPAERRWVETAAGSVTIWWQRI